MTEPPPNTPHRERMATPLPSFGLFGSQLTEQLHKEKDLGHSDSSLVGGVSFSSDKTDDGSRSSSKSRSLSHPPKPSLSPSPAFREPARATKDDTHIISSPSTPRRPGFPPRGLSLQMPPRELGSPVTPSLGSRGVPLSPKLDSSISYGSPASVLPRRSRGLDFARACTNLHHSTLAEISSPDSSPTITGRGVNIPQRKGLGNTSAVLESPNMVGSSLWSTMGNTDRISHTISSSVSSVNMLDSDSGSTDSDGDDEPMDHGGEADDAMTTTPQVYKLGSSLANPFGPAAIASPGGEWLNNPMNYSPAAASLMSFQRARLRKGRSRKSSSSGNSSLQSPGPLSPPPMKSIESMNGGYFEQERRREIQSRRESLSLGTNDLHLSDAGDSDEGDEKAVGSSSSSGAIPGTPTADGKQRGVVKRPVTRRSNMLPKTKNFARIRAALFEEGAPVDSEVRREAEVIRQVRESDASTSITISPNLSGLSPSLGPTTTEPLDLDDDAMSTSTGIDTPTGSLSLSRRVSTSFSRQALKNGMGVDFWNRFSNDERTRTPPPFLPRHSSSTEDIPMGTPPSQLSASASHLLQESLRMQDANSRSRSSTPQPLTYPQPPTQLQSQPQSQPPQQPPAPSEFTRKLTKRRRDDDFDPYSFKRRAVSPGMSLQSSPVLPQSPVTSKDPSGLWGAPPNQKSSAAQTGSALGMGDGMGNSSREASGENKSEGSKEGGGSKRGEGRRANSGGSSNSVKRVGLQGMTDTSDGLMNMSIE